MNNFNLNNNLTKLAAIFIFSLSFLLAAYLFLSLCFLSFIWVFHSGVVFIFARFVCFGALLFAIFHSIKHLYWLD